MVLNENKMKVKVFQPIDEERINAWLGDGSERLIHAMHVSAGGTEAASVCLVQYEDVPEPRARDFGFPSIQR